MDNIEAGEVVVITLDFTTRCSKDMPNIRFRFSCLWVKLFVHLLKQCINPTQRTNGTDYAERYWQIRIPADLFYHI